LVAAVAVTVAVIADVSTGGTGAAVTASKNWLLVARTGRCAMRSSAAAAAMACLALLSGGCTHTYACASAGEPAGLASTSPPRALMCPGSLPTSTVPSAHARLSGSWESNPVTAVVGQRIVATVRSPYVPLRSIPQASRPSVLCYVSAVRGRYAATVVFAARHPGPVLVIAFAGVGGCGTASDIYAVKIVVRSR
jgi:hypothetical protein